MQHLNSSSQQPVIRILLFYFISFRLYATIPFVLTSSSASVVSHYNEASYQILNETVAYSRWRTVLQRTVRSPNGRVMEYDIIGQRNHNYNSNDQNDAEQEESNTSCPSMVRGAVIVFAWDTQTKTATLVREYNPGCHRMLYGPAAGLLENGEKHNYSDPLVAAQMELEEECHLAGGRWYRLAHRTYDTNECLGGVFMDKYVNTEIIPYLVIDPITVTNPRARDVEEEDMVIVKGVPVDDLWDMIFHGKMNLVGSWATLLALEKLRQLGEI